MRKTVWFYLGYFLIVANALVFSFGGREFEQAAIGCFLGIAIMVSGLERT